MSTRFPIFLVTLSGLTAVAAPSATDWPTHRHDVRRSGATSTTLTLPLTPRWTHQAGRPRQAWSGPAKWDAFSGNDGLQSMRNFDPCHHLSIASGKLYYGSSTDDAVHCLDATTGDTLWTFFTNGPVRFPPTLSADMALFGSDDGHAYCLDAATGGLRWKKRAAPSDRLIPSNGKLISPWPVRTGVLVADGRAWFASSLVPWESSYLWCVDAATGNEEDGFLATHNEVTLQGSMLAGGGLVYIPQGRAAPLAFNQENGKSAGSIGHAGGVTCVLTEDNKLLAGPAGQKAASSEIKLTDLASGKPIATFNHTNCVTVSGHIAYLHSGDSLRALDLSVSPQPRELWTVPHPAPVELIVADSHLIVGLPDEVVIIDSSNGKILSSLKVDGTAYGLAAAGDSLYVSTNRGAIHAFGP